MNRHVADAYKGAIQLKDETLENAYEKAPDLPKGWLELSKLSTADRIEFARGFWLATLPYNPEIHAPIAHFFDGLEEIHLFLTQQASGGPFLAEMVYSLKEDGGFFHGFPPATDEQIAALEGEFDRVQFPDDYLTFLTIHDGFSKANDTGMIPVDAMPLVYSDFQTMLAEVPQLELPHHEGLHQESLIPFYQSFGLNCYQCFYADWYPETEMGNLYYSGVEHTVSNYHEKETLAFPTLLHWLNFYLETVDDV